MIGVLVCLVGKWVWGNVWWGCCGFNGWGDVLGGSFWVEVGFEWVLIFFWWKLNWLLVYCCWCLLLLVFLFRIVWMGLWLVVIRWLLWSWKIRCWFVCMCRFLGCWCGCCLCLWCSGKMFFMWLRMYVGWRMWVVFWLLRWGVGLIILWIWRMLWWFLMGWWCVGIGEWWGVWRFVEYGIYVLISVVMLELCGDVWKWVVMFGDGWWCWCWWDVVEVLCYCGFGGSNFGEIFVRECCYWIVLFVYLINFEWWCLFFIIMIFCFSVFFCCGV